MKTELEERTKKFAVQIVKTAACFSKTAEGQIIGRQLLKARTSIGANYREANRAESRVDFIHKIGIAEKKLPKQFIGWKFVRKPKLRARKRLTVGTKKLANCWRF
jgi:23S rRNA-intervening sequence protein